MDQGRPESAEVPGDAPVEPGAAPAPSGGAGGFAAWAREGRWALLAVILSLWAIALLWLISNNAPSAGGEPPRLVVFTALPPTPTPAASPVQPATLAQPTVAGGVAAP